MKPVKIILAIAVAILVAAGIALWTAQATGSKASPAACKSALAKQLEKSMSDDSEGKKPAQCQGLSDDKIAELALQVMSEK